MDAVAIQDANKIRVAMGLAPLPVPGEDGLQFKSKDDGEESDPDDMSTLEKRQAAAGDNWMKLQDEEKARQARQARKEEAKRARDMALRNAKLEGKGLGDAEEADMDAKTWALQFKKRQKKIEAARRYEEEQAELERQAQVEYSAKDLAGVKVAHELDQFDAEGEQILTLKDAAIGDESEDDELENLDLRAKEQLQEKLERKKNKPVYNPNDMDDGNRSILAHYDEEIDGKKKKAFILDTSGAIDQVALTAQREATEAERIGVKGIKFSLDELKDDTPTSDYLDASTAKIRKPKKPKKAKTTRTKAADEDDIFPLPTQEPSGDQMDVDGQPMSNGAAKKRTFETFDDDDLQAKLAEQRRQALKKRKKTDAAELARRIREQESADIMNTAEDDEEPGLVIDETTEFVANLKRRQSPDSEDERTRATSTPAAGDIKDEDETMEESYGAVEDEEDTRARLEASERESASLPAMTSTGFEDEEDTSSGAGGILNMLRKRGLVQDSDAEKANAAVRAQQQFLQENQALVDEYDRKTREEREKDRNSGRWDRMSHRERENYQRQQNEQRDAYLAQLQAEHFKRSYKPNVQLRYNDEDGREMNQKEAFKHLSHRFHGKGSGKQKTEKRMKKKQEEDDRQRKSLLGFTGTNEAVGATAKKNRQAGVRLQ
jgi:U4/U6.U5 tri-snRNP-associated protein 1